jgi:hypothetical protein
MLDRSFISFAPAVLSKGLTVGCVSLGYLEQDLPTALELLNGRMDVVEVEHGGDWN